MNELMNERKSIMKKKLYSIPQTEVALTTGACSIMKTSIGMNDTNLPSEPGMAPKRRTDEVF